MQQATADGARAERRRIADAFLTARRTGAPVRDYPGRAPASLDEAYAIQDAAIVAWPAAIAGWKVGRIVGADAERLGADRLAGPIFADRMRLGAMRQPAEIFAEGFAAVEGEIVIILRADAPPEKTEWSLEETRALIGAVHAGAEIASSPFAMINDHGPLVTISDFGNNFGLVVGDEIPDWRRFDVARWTCETRIDGASVGRENPGSIPGGPIESLRFLLELSARRGLPLRRGAAVSTGAITGVHSVRVGQSASVAFDGVRPIIVDIVAYAPAAPASAARIVG